MVKYCFVTFMHFIGFYFFFTQCMTHSWYLAVEFQLSIVAVVLVTLLLRLPRLKAAILTIVSTVCFIIPGVVVYLGGYEGTIILSPEYKISFKKKQIFDDSTD